MDLTPLRKVEVTGPGAEAVLQATVTRDLRRLGDGQVVYTGLCDEDGNLLDDGTVLPLRSRALPMGRLHRRGRAWFRQHADRLGLEVSLRNSTDELHNIAVQGPASRDIVTSVVWTPESATPVADLTWFRFTEGRVGGADGPAAVVSRTGYSGELGYELWSHPDDGPAVWDAVWAAGEPHGLAPLGLDALDVVRIDAGLIFKGYEYDGAEDPFEAGIGFVVTKSKEDDFVGKQALARRGQHPTQTLVGLDGRGSLMPSPPVRSSPEARRSASLRAGRTRRRSRRTWRSLAFRSGTPASAASSRWQRPTRVRRRSARPSSVSPSTIPTRPVPGRSRPWRRGARSAAAGTARRRSSRSRSSRSGRRASRALARPARRPGQLRRRGGRPLRPLLRLHPLGADLRRGRRGLVLLPASKDRSAPARQKESRQRLSRTSGHPGPLLASRPSPTSWR